MAFPSGYTKYQEVVVQSSQVPADQTDFTIYINLADLSKAGADIFDTCRTDGGDIRVTKSDGTTELAREVADIDTTGKTGTLFVKFTGTLSSSTDTVIRIWYNGTDTEPAVTATYGRNNAWDSDYAAVLHLSEAANTTTDGYVDSTGNGNDGTGVSMAMTASTGKLAGSTASQFDGSADYIDIPHVAAFSSTKYTGEFWIYLDATGSNDVFWDEATSGYYRAQMQGTTGYTNFNGSSSSTDTTSTATWYQMQMTSDNTVSSASHIQRRNNTKYTANTSARSDGSGACRLGSYGSVGSFMLDGLMQEFRFSTVERSDNWLTTHHNNQNAPATFYSTGDEQTGGGGGPVQNSNFLALMQ